MNPQDPGTVSVSLDMPRQEFESGRAIFLDIREPREHAAGAIAGALFVSAWPLALPAPDRPAAPEVPGGRSRARRR